MIQLAQAQIFLPLLTLVGLTFLVLLQIPYRRFRAAAQGEVRKADFRLGESDRVPDNVRLANRNYMNLLELPALFHLACISCFVLQALTPLLLTLAWIYVGMRAIHSAIHLTYNDVYHRLAAFALSNIVLACLWILLATSVFELTSAA